MAELSEFGHLDIFKTNNQKFNYVHMFLTLIRIWDKVTSKGTWVTHLGCPIPE